VDFGLVACVDYTDARNATLSGRLTNVIGLDGGLRLAELLVGGQ
jgi:hypothetical protein